MAQTVRALHCPLGAVTRLGAGGGALPMVMSIIGPRETHDYRNYPLSARYNLITKKSKKLTPPFGAFSASATYSTHNSREPYSSAHNTATSVRLCNTLGFVAYCAVWPACVNRPKGHLVFILSFSARRHT